MTTYDVIVAGGGTMGTAAAWALAKHGLKPVVLEQFHHVHDKGAHGGETRIIRHAYAESADYVPLVRRADQLWLELEDIINQHVLVRTGGLELSAPGFDHAHAARRAADEYGLPYEWLTPAEANARWAGLTVPEDWSVMHSPNSGFLLTESALRGMADAAKRLGATFVEHAPVTAWGADSQSTWVETPVGGFDGEAGVFFGEDLDDGRFVLVRFDWLKRGPEGGPRWSQAFSLDGQAWETNWVMDFVRP